MGDTVPIEEEEDGGGVEAGLLRGWTSYVVRALRKHKWVVLAGLGLGLGGAALFNWAWPDYYLVEARLAAQRPDIIASFGNPGRPRLSAAGDASAAAHDVVKGRDNLLALIRQTGLLEHWRKNRSPFGRLRDRLTYGRELDDEELTAVLVDILDDRLLAYSDPGSVFVLVTWNDPEMAYRLVDGALQNYIETRHVTSMAMLGESVSLLKERLVAAEKLLNEALVAARKARPAPRRRAPRVEPEPRSSVVPTQTTMELLRIRAEIASRTRTLEDLIAFRERRIAELLAELDEKKAVYGDSHPTIVTLEGSLAALSQDSPQVLALRRELEELESRYVARGGKLADLDSLDYEIATSPTRATTPSVIAALEGPLKDPAEEFARSQLTAAMVRYNTLVDRLEAAQIERDAMTAGNKYRYLVVKAPTRPDKPVNRNKKRLVWVAGALAGLLLGGLAAFGLVYRQGRIVQTWQVEQGLGLPILAELPPPESWPGRS
jgi:uncharacterized protein involved in exopolysaccharide biosynthesis